MPCVVISLCEWAHVKRQDVRSLVIKQATINVVMNAILFYCNLVTDDIFADSGVPTKTKKDSEKKKKSTSKKKEEVEDIFDDPLNAAAP